MALPTQSTLLSAVNTVLRKIQEAPVSSLNAPFTDDVGMALETIQEVQLELLGKGWSFNLESDLPLTLDVDNKYAVPSNVLQITRDDRGCSRQNLVPRDDAGVLRLYDRDAHSFTLTPGLKVTVITAVDFEDLPQAFKHYIQIRAGNIFKARQTGSPVTPAEQMEEIKAQKALRDFEVRSERPSVFNNWSVWRVIRRGYPKIEHGDF